MDCFLERMGIALHLILPTLIKTEIIISALTGGRGASSIVASPFLAHQLTYLCNRIFSFQSTRQGIKKIPSMCRQREDLFDNHF